VTYKPERPLLENLATLRITLSTNHSPHTSPLRFLLLSLRKWFAPHAFTKFYDHVMQNLLRLDIDFKAGFRIGKAYDC
jgi:hypothetical protein